MYTPPVKLCRSRVNPPVPSDLVVQRADRPFTPTPEPMRCAKPIAATAPVQAPHARSRRQFPIAHAAPPLHHRPRFPALALLGRWLPQRADGLRIPASENLHKLGSIIPPIHSASQGLYGVSLLNG